MDENGIFNAKYLDAAFVGTVPYVSVNTHQHKAQSYRDDLEGLGYSILNLLVGDKNLWFTTNSLYAKDFITPKLEFITSNSTDPRLVHIRSYLKAVHSLSFEAVPDYASLSEVLSKLN